MLHEGYKYLKIGDGKECTFWRCEKHKSQCPGRVTTYMYEDSVQSCKGKHNHPPDLAAKKVKAAISNMRKRAREETVTIPQIYDEALQVISKLLSLITSIYLSITCR